MRPAALVSAIVFTALAVGGLIWIGRYAPRGDSASLFSSTEGKKDPPVTQTGNTETVQAPVPSPTPPWPLVEVEAPLHDFGLMETNSEKSHTFVIRNRGEAPLIVKKGNTSCKCTLSDVKDQTVPAGGAMDVTLTWKSTVPSAEFQQTATVLTNDPKNKTVTLSIKGRVEGRLLVVPPDAWNLGTTSSDEPSSVVGKVFSPFVEKFAVTQVEADATKITSEVTPLTAKELAELHSKSGYAIKLTFAPAPGVGSFREEFKIHTDVSDAKPIALALLGTRSGPLDILPGPGFVWTASVNAINLGAIDAKKGATAQLFLFVRGVPDDDFRFVEVAPQPEYLKVDLQRDPKYVAKGRGKYALTFTIPPAPPAVRLGKGSARVVVKTNHPEAPEIKFYIEYVSK